MIADTLLECDVHELGGVREVADDPDAERSVGELARPPDLLDEPRRTADGGAADHAEPAGVRDRGRELRRRVAATHRCVHDRVLDPEAGRRVGCAASRHHLSSGPPCRSLAS